MRAISYVPQQWAIEHLAILPENLIDEIINFVTTMTIDQQKKMMTSGRLVLSRKRLLKHYETLFYFGLPMLFALGCFIYFQLHDGIAHIISPKMSLLGLPALGVAIFLNQYNGLKFTKLNTILPKEKNYEIAKETIRQLNWTMQSDSESFLEAFNPYRDFRTWGDEMISIVIAEHQIMINSICNIDTHQSQAALSFGKNRQNVRGFCQTFKLIAKSKGSGVLVTT
ncbi:MAG TPA: hypothetical protein VK563_22195 [Puia sp.]|nr:hypothetical protein [Puia sp.]